MKILKIKIGCSIQKLENEIFSVWIQNLETQNSISIEKFETQNLLN